MVFSSKGITYQGFPPLWCEWVARFIQGGIVGIRVNDDLKGFTTGISVIPDTL
jgi:hypothetical protein